MGLRASEWVVVGVSGWVGICVSGWACMSVGRCGCLCVCVLFHVCIVCPLWEILVACPQNKSKQSEQYSLVVAIALSLVEWLGAVGSE